MKTLSTMLVLLVAAAAVQTAPADADAEFAALRDVYVARFKPLFLEATAAHWEALTTGTEPAAAREKAANRALVELNSDPVFFARLKALREAGQVRDPVLRRELDVLYRTLLPDQANPELRKQIVELESDVQRLFNTHRSRVGERLLSENEVRQVLATTRDSAAAEAAWKGYMEVGRAADATLRELVRLRNELARQLGFANYFEMSLALDEIDQQQLFQIFDALDQLTGAPFAQLKDSLDTERAAHFGITVAQLRPWHYGDLFFQETPPGLGVDFDELYRNVDLLAMSRRYYASIGLPVDEILARSDLYERPGKCPHAYCVNMDRYADIRVLANLVPNLYWADTILHELGHCLNDLHIRPDVPYLLRAPAHALTTEGVAMLFGALARNEEFLTQLVGVEPAEAARIGRAARAAQRAERLIFCRWAQVMVRFEHGMYADPGQNLGRLWWDLKRRYQLLNPPESVDRPDYAAKTHILNTPVYYHSYMLGELFAAQVRHYIARNVLRLDDASGTSFYGRPEVGAYLREKIFGPGNLYAWNELLQQATGAPLTPEYFAAELREPPDP